MTVFWNATGGSTSASSTTTDADGETGVLWTLGTTTGSNELSASVADDNIAAEVFHTRGEPDAPATATLSPNPVSFAAINDTAFVSVTELSDRYGNPIHDATLAWASADTSVATVDTLGRAVAKGDGIATITAVASAGVSDQATLTVDRVAAFVTISPPEVTLGEGQTTQLTAEVADSNGIVIPDPAVTWSTGDQTVAEVDATGQVPATGWWSTFTIITATSDGVDGYAAIEVLGQLAFRQDVSATDYEIIIVHEDGTGRINCTNHSATDLGPDWSPDGTRIAFRSARTGSGDIYIMNADGTGQTNVTDAAAAEDRYPTWSPEGDRILYHSDRDGHDQLYVINVDGTGRTRLTNHADEDLNPRWRPAP